MQEQDEKRYFGPVGWIVNCSGQSGQLGEAAFSRKIAINKLLCD
jgi:hypothetical protein